MARAGSRIPALFTCKVCLFVRGAQGGAETGLIVRAARHPHVWPIRVLLTGFAEVYTRRRWV